MYVRNIGVLAPAGCPVGWWHADHRARPSKIGVLAPAGPRGCGTAIFGRPWAPWVCSGR